MGLRWSYLLGVRGEQGNPSPGQWGSLGCPPNSCPSSGSGMGCLRGHHPWGWHSWALRLPCHPSGASGALNPWTRLFKTLPFTWCLYSARRWQFNPLAGQSGWGHLACEHRARPKSPLCTQRSIYPACQSLTNLAASLFTLLVSY